MILVRHGETDLNDKNTNGGEQFRGWTDVPLNANGKKEAKETAKLLEDEDISRIYTSPYSRASHVANLIGDYHSVPVMKTASLKPWDIGEYSGKLVKEYLPHLLLHQKHESIPTPGGEAFSKFRERYLGFLDRSLKYEKQHGQHTLLVTHVRNAQLAKAWHKKGRPADLSFDEDVMNDYDKALKTGEYMEL